MKNKIIFRNEYFSAYGLNKDKNFIQSPKCPCGCGKKCVVLLEDYEAVEDFAVNMLLENDCNHCAIFTHDMLGKMIAFIKLLDDDDEIEIARITGKDTDFSLFSQLDNDFDFHCYGLIIESNNGEWKIIED